MRNLNNKKILLTGVSGQVGHALSSQLLDLNLVTLSRNELDLSDADAIRRVLREVSPDIIINPAAFTAVDKAELEPDLAYAINVTAPRVMAEEAAKLGSALIHFSTDYVFDGNQEKSYTERDPANPTNVYGKTKLAGEEAIRNVGIPFLILRTSWVYGPHGKNFLKTILHLASEKEHLGIVSDQIGSPTSSLSIAAALNQLLRLWNTEKASDTGIYHFTNAGSTSWYGFACEIIKQYEVMHKQPALKTAVHNIKALSSAEYPTLATRPANSCLDNTKLKKTFGIELPSWQDGLQQVLQDL